MEQRRKTLYLTIFFSETRLGEPVWGHWKGLVGPCTHIFFSSRSDQQEPSYNGLKGTKEKNIIGPIGADTEENRTGVIGKDSSRPLRPYFFRPDRTNRSQVITHLGEPDRGNNGKKHFSLTIFFSETIAQRRTGLGSLERTRRALYAHIFFVQIGPIGADTEENRTGVIGKGSSRPVRTYFFRPDRTNRSQVITENLIGVIGKDSSRHLRPYFFRPDRTNRSQVITHLEEPERGHWKGLVAPSTPIFFLPDRTNRSRVITHPGEPVWGHWKGLVGPCTHIFFSSRSDQQEPSYNGLKGTMEKNIEPSYNGLKVTKEKKHFSLTIFFSETIAPRRTGLGSLERARRALYAHIFFVQIGPIGAKVQRRKTLYLTIFFSETVAPRRTGPGSLERTRRALYAHIFFFQIGPIGADAQENRCGVIGKDSSRPLRPYFFRPDRNNRSRVITHPGEPVWAPRRTDVWSLERARRALYAHIFFVQIGPIGAKIQENPSGVIGKDSSRPLRPYFFLPDWTNRSRVITKNLSGVIGKDSSRPLRPYFFRPDRTNRSQVITHLGEPDRGHSKGLVPPSTPIFFSSRSDQQEPSYNDRTNRSRVITHLEKPEWGLWKGLAATCTPIFFRPYRTNRSRVITV
ncbi:hypothetical protein V1477_017850 [Vespula maculifrons]|uniref:Uncharacterized protein n=1 Tax=Vespula maculifrons TaxID=7453 RepID=A0ABD2B0A6_VESMC